ncbi:MAG: GAF domain-containing protein [Planctomycetes bacterium]|nr:GAF domain-containing protein [Planctomycetota bacterium]
MNRPYEAIATAQSVFGSVEERMRRVVDALWDALSDMGVSWVGLYLPDDNGEMVLGASRNKPACSPIGLHGVCGRVLRSGLPLIVRDVRDLGEAYIPCDPNDRSEVVMPLVGSDGKTYAVLDLDSHDIGAFDENDVSGLNRVLQAAGLTHSPV